MVNSKYSKVLTIILIIVIIAIIGILIFLGVDYYRKYYIDKEAGEAIDQFEEQVKNEVIQNNNISDNSTGSGGIADPYGNLVNETSSDVGGSNEISKKYKGYDMLGYIEIPKTDIRYPVIDEVNPRALETSVARLHGPGLNEIGNTTIVGHNYRNGLFFSDNDKLEIGDKIYITDLSGTKRTYEIYDKFITYPEDANFMTVETNGVREISLSTCTDDSKERIIIKAREV